ncbi:hypothetical protein SEA_NICEHOUSE_243 [Rhodococcus phage NiceHouse]|nr:hypothetical protein SEA_NICEHOUSE_243 [Rhodococcus phage NiceHouse]
MSTKELPPPNDARGVPIEIGARVVFRTRARIRFGEVTETKKMAKVKFHSEWAPTWVHANDCIVVADVPYVSGKFNGTD